MYYDSEISARLSKIDLTFAHGGYTFKTYWCRVTMNKGGVFNGKEHSHSFFELHLALKGEGCFLADGKTYSLKSGEYLLFAPEKRHTALSESEDFEKFVWGFEVLNTDKDGGRRLFTALRERSFFNCGESILELLSLIFKDVKERARDYIETVRLKLFLLFTELLRAVLPPEKEEESQKTESDPRMGMIAAYVEDNILHGLTAGDVSKELGLCEKQLSRICMYSCNQTLFGYISRKKIEMARRLLKETDLTLSELAELLGYSDAYSFGKAFKREEGMSPVKFRNSTRL
ncbi:MAG: helix-turn-helix domain-containing protein [Clostridia bacterium]|nr:helix-turn-helix domain-containing protein [Clostridia bacterium]